MKKQIFLLPIFLFTLFSSCSEQESDLSPLAPNILVEKSRTVSEQCTYTVSPSGDMTGVTDPINIETALNAVGASGGKVCLTDGNSSTVDEYYISEGIAVEDGFRGTLIGESKENTIINAISKPDGSDFFFDFVSKYYPDGFPVENVWPTVIHFEYPEQVKVSNLTVSESNPTNSYVGVFQHLAIWGGDHNVMISDVRFNKELFNSYAPQSFGIHVMAGTQIQKQDGIGNIKIKNVEVNDLEFGVMPMWYDKGSSILIENVKTTNAQIGIYATNIDGGLEIFGCMLNSCIRDAIGLSGVVNSHISSNVIKDQYFEFISSSGIRLIGAQNCLVEKNSFINLSGQGQAILLQSHFFYGSSVKNIIRHNDFSKSNITGSTSDDPYDLLAITLFGDTYENFIHIMKFFPNQYNDICQMIWDTTDDPSTPDYDGDNIIRNFQPCANMTRRKIFDFEEMAEFNPFH